MMEVNAATTGRNHDGTGSMMDDSNPRHEKLADYSKRRATFNSTSSGGAVDMELDDESSRHHSQASLRRLSNRASLLAGDKELVDAISTTAFLLSLPTVEATTDEAASDHRVVNNISLSSIDNSTQSSWTKLNRNTSSTSGSRRRSLQDKRLSCSDRLRLSLSYRNIVATEEESDSKGNTTPTATNELRSASMHDTSPAVATRPTTCMTSPSTTILSMPDLPRLNRAKSTGSAPSNISGQKGGERRHSGNNADDVKFTLRRRYFHIAAAKRASLNISDSGDMVVSSTDRLHMSLSNLMIDESIDEGDEGESAPDNRRRQTIDAEEEGGHQPLKITSILNEVCIIDDEEDEQVPDRTRRRVEEPAMVKNSTPLAPLSQSTGGDKSRHERSSRRGRSRTSLGGSSPNLISPAETTLWNLQPKSRTELSGMIHRNSSFSNSSSSMKEDSSPHRRQRRSRSNLLGSQSMRDASSSPDSMMNAQWPSKQIGSTGQLGQLRGMRQQPRSQSFTLQKNKKSESDLKMLLRKANRRSTTRLALSAVALAGDLSQFDNKNNNTNAPWTAKPKVTAPKNSLMRGSSIRLDRLKASFTDLMDASTGSLLSDSLLRPTVTARQKKSSPTLATTPRYRQSTGSLLLDYMMKKKQEQPHHTSPTHNDQQNAQWTSSNSALPRKDSPSSIVNSKLAKLASLHRSVSTNSVVKHRAASETSAAWTTNLVAVNATGGLANPHTSRIVSLADLKERFGSKAASRNSSRVKLSINATGTTTSSQNNIQALAELKRQLLQSKVGASASASISQLGIQVSSAQGIHNFDWNSQKSATSRQTKRPVMANPFLSIVNGTSPATTTSTASNKRVKALAPDGITVISRSSSFAAVAGALSAAVSSNPGTSPSMVGHSSRTSLTQTQRQVLLGQLRTTAASAATTGVATDSGSRPSLLQSQEQTLLGQLKGSAKSGARSSSCLPQILLLNHSPRCGSSAANLMTMHDATSQKIGRGHASKRLSRQNLMSDSINNDPSHFVTGSRIRRYSSGALAVPSL